MKDKEFTNKSPDSGVLQFKKPNNMASAIEIHGLEGNNKVETTESVGLTHKASSSYMDMIANAVSSGASIEALERLMALKERHDKEVARQSFLNALSDFQMDSPDIRKTKRVEFGTTQYMYAPLADIDRQLRKPMKDHGFSKRWEIQDNGDEIKVTCIIAHIGGHTEQTSMTAKPDVSGSKNPIQARGSAIEYMKRYTLVGALGITTADSDIDGRLPDVDVDKLHEIYMDLYHKVPHTDPQKAAMDPDNWKTERTGKVYVAAIGAARKKLIELAK